MMRWFTADLHFGHANIIQYCGRPFRDVEDMNEGLITLWNSQVHDEDEIYVLGDLAFCGTSRQVDIVSRLRGKKYIVLGNHDKSGAHMQKVGFHILPSGITVPIGDRHAILSHFPYKSAALDPRDTRDFSGLMLEDEGEWLLHGHVHTQWKQQGKQINVGVDVWGWLPVSEQSILAIMQGVVNYEETFWDPTDLTGTVVVCSACLSKSANTSLEGQRHDGCPYGGGKWTVQMGLFA